MGLGILLLLLVLWAGEVALFHYQSGLHGGVKPRQRASAKRSAGNIWICEPFLRTMDRLKLWEKLPVQLTAIHRRLVILNGTGHSIEETKRFMAESVGFGYLSMTAGALLSAAGDEPMLLQLGGLMAVIVPLARIRDVQRKLEKRRQDMLLALPELLSKLILLTGAGETLMQAIIRCLERHRMESGGVNPLFTELEKMCNEVRNGVSFPSALETFSKRCAVQEVALFTTALLLNHRRGGGQFTASLRELSGVLWEKRKAIARSRGEEASSKLVFPLVVIFLVLMTIVASPAMLLLS
ncbi:type II secretion system F family protein [Paenibacillus tarimensis]